MSNVDKIAKDLAGIIKSSDSKATAPYDTKATVKKVENGIAWVQIPGGVDETPVQMTLSAKAGDTVQVRVSGGRAWITGNGTNPPTDDTRANQAYNIADNAIIDAQRARNAADNAEASAADAKATADAVHDIAVQASEDAAEAEAAATTANTAATGALTGLSTVQDVIGMLNWAQENATYSLTQDTDIMPGKTYWTRSGAGTAADPYVYTPVPSPVKTALGTYYEITGVDEAMGDFINAHLALTDEGLWILPDGMDTASYRVLIATGGQGHTYEDAGTYIIDSAGKTVAKLGEVITLGVNDNLESFMQLDYHSTQLIDKEDNPYFYISDLRDKDDNWQATIEEVFSGNGTTRDFYVQLPVSQEISATDSSDVSNSATRVGGKYTFTNIPADGATVTITYKTTDVKAKAYTLGIRKNGKVGAMSFAEGYNTIASGIYSHAEGINSIASGGMSHAEGVSTAKGSYSHAEGSGAESRGSASHAEGYNTLASGNRSHAEGSSSSALGDSSHAEGLNTEASGLYSHAQNNDTIARKSSQTALGTFNSPDYGSTTHPSGYTHYGKYAVILGNGTSNSHRSNALTVDWQGNVDIASGAKYKINGVALSASDVDAVPTTRKVNNKALSSDITLTASDVSALPISGGTITGDLTVNGDTTLEGTTYLGLDVDSSASKTTPATSGEDKDLFNAIRDLGWYDDVIA